MYSHGYTYVNVLKQLELAPFSLPIAPLLLMYHTYLLYMCKYITYVYIIYFMPDIFTERCMREIGFLCDSYFLFLLICSSPVLSACLKMAYFHSSFWLNLTTKCTCIPSLYLYTCCLIPRLIQSNVWYEYFYENGCISFCIVCWLRFLCMYSKEWYSWIV